MDRDNAVIAASITVVGLICAFIFYGPSTIARPRRRSVVIGLQNLGLTCYLNSLLQALAACHTLVDWLNNQKYKGRVANAMQELLNILNNPSEFASGETFVSPVKVVEALHHAGWTITNSQQDVHELLCTLLNILEEESHNTFFGLNVGYNIVEYMELTKKVKIKDKKRVLRVHRRASSDVFDVAFKVDSSPNHNDLKCKPNCHASSEDVLECKHSNGFLPSNHVYNSVPCCSNSNAVSADSQSLKKRRRNSSSTDKPNPSPFRGYLVNRIECTQCSYKSVLRFEKFDIISLHLPESSQQPCIYKLTQLLENFIKHEMINDISCEGCNENRDSSSQLVTTPAIKLIRFGKMPPCLCFHIVRTAFHEFGVYKRQDYVDFPEYLVMDPYVYRATKHNTFTSEQTLQDLWSQTINNQNPDSNVADNVDTGVSFSAKYTYKLNAVIVHRGSHNDGHFMTYRRGSSKNSNKRWYLVSDVDVKETTLYNVLSSVVYVLFYERCYNTTD